MIAEETIFGGGASRAFASSSTFADLAVHKVHVSGSASEP